MATCDEQYEFEVTNNDQDIDKSALAVLEIGEHREGYWNSDRCCESCEDSRREVSTITGLPPHMVL